MLAGRASSLSQFIEPASSCKRGIIGDIGISKRHPLQADLG